MEKILEKKNLGVPATIVCVLAYIVGYSLTNSFSNLLVALLLAFVVFSLQFEDRVRVAVKQAYVFAFFVNIIYLMFDILNKLLDLGASSSRRFFSFSFIHNPFNILLALIKITVIVFFLLFILFALMKKDIKMNFLVNMLDDTVPNPNQRYQQPAQPMYQQPIQQPAQQSMYQNPVQQPAHQPMYQQPIQQPTQQSMYQKPVQQPVQQSVQQQQVQQSVQPTPCSNCGAVNQPGSLFCAKCGFNL